VLYALYLVTVNLQKAPVASKRMAGAVGCMRRCSSGGASGSQRRQGVRAAAYAGSPASAAGAVGSP